MFDTLPLIAGRIVLRRLRRDDLRAFQFYRHDEEVGRYQSWAPEPDDEAAAFLERMGAIPLFPTGEWVQLAIADPPTDGLIGDIGLYIDDDVAEIGFTLSPRWQRRGLATEAVSAAIQLVFEQTEAERIIGITDARNSASVRLLERVGMHRVATDKAVFRGEECIEHTFAISRQAESSWHAD
jgi:RimJ/RimL family protein N-acetyltransferase